MDLDNINVKQIRSNRTTIALNVDSSGMVILRTPHNVNSKLIDDFITKNRDWIITRVIESKRNIKTYNFTIGSSVPFMGEFYILKENSSLKSINMESMFIELPSSTNIKKQLLAWYKSYCRKEILKLVNHYTELLEITYNRVFIKNQKTRWGSCSGKRNLNFNWKIILTKPSLINYLVIHEVCHLVEMNHSKRYWDLVKKYDKNFVSHRRELLKYSYYLSTFIE